MKIYVIGSLRNTQIPAVANALRAAGHEAFDDWFSPGPDADKFWQAYEKERGRDYFQAINGPHAFHVFEFDQKWLDWSEAVVLVLAAGKSAHIELGYAAGWRAAQIALGPDLKKCSPYYGKAPKRCYVVFDAEPERYDIMYRFADGLFPNIEELIEGLKA